MQVFMHIDVFPVPEVPTNSVWFPVRTPPDITKSKLLDISAFPLTARESVFVLEEAAHCESGSKKVGKRGRREERGGKVRIGRGGGGRKNEVRRYW